MLWIWPILAVLLSLAVIAAMTLYLHVDDWQRDLTTNHAATSDERDAALKHFHSDLPPAELANDVIAAAGKLRGWRLDRLSEAAGMVTLRFIRTTPLLRFKDDIVVTIEREESGSILKATSRSRIGRGDLGQNPRNLSELLAALADEPEK